MMHFHIPEINVAKNGDKPLAVAKRDIKEGEFIVVLVLPGGTLFSKDLDFIPINDPTFFSEIIKQNLPWPYGRDGGQI